MECLHLQRSLVIILLSFEFSYVHLIISILAILIYTIEFCSHAVNPALFITMPDYDTEKRKANACKNPPPGRITILHIDGIIPPTHTATILPKAGYVSRILLYILLSETKKTKTSTQHICTHHTCCLPLQAQCHTHSNRVWLHPRSEQGQRQSRVSEGGISI